MTNANESGGGAFHEVMKPQPEWTEDPVRNDAGEWCGRYFLATRKSSWVEVCTVQPSGDRVPTKIGGVWYWVAPASPGPVAVESGGMGR